MRYKDRETGKIYTLNDLFTEWKHIDNSTLYNMGITTFIEWVELLTDMGGTLEILR